MAYSDVDRKPNLPPLLLFSSFCTEKQEAGLLTRSLRYFCLNLIVLVSGYAACDVSNITVLLSMNRRTLALLAATTLTKSARSMSMTTTTISTSERTFTCSDGVKLVVKSWSNANTDDASNNTITKKILCLHGWLDNAASFNRLAPLLLDSSTSLSSDEQQEQPMEILALDFPGHGLSGHKSVDGPPQLLAEVSFCM